MEIFRQALVVATRQWPEWQWLFEESVHQEAFFLHASVPGLPLPVRSGISKALLIQAPPAEWARLAAKLVHAVVMEVAERRRVLTEQALAGAPGLVGPHPGVPLMSKGLLTGSWSVLPSSPPVGGEHPVVTELAKLVPALKDKQLLCPMPTCKSQGKAPLAQVIIHLNDKHQQSREWIADWLDSLKGIDLTLQPASVGD